MEFWKLCDVTTSDLVIFGLASLHLYITAISIQRKTLGTQNIGTWERGS